MAEALAKVQLKKKGTALQQKKDREAAQKLEEEVARKAMSLEAEMESNMTPDERRALEKKRVEDADLDSAMDLFGGVDDGGKKAGGGGGKSQGAGDTVVLKDLKDHLKHASKVRIWRERRHITQHYLKSAPAPPLSPRSALP